jgi:hypothetical protein
MAIVTKTGNPGANGADGVFPGGSGSDGAPGGIATAKAMAGADINNIANATGGQGGLGGAAGLVLPGGTPGSPGAGGAGGKAMAMATTTQGTSLPAGNFAQAVAQGGGGGDAGLPQPGGAGNAGGAGAEAMASASTTNSLGFAGAMAVATGGAGGVGHGGSAAARAAPQKRWQPRRGAGGSEVTVQQTGGNGGGSPDAANGGAGAGSKLGNASFGNATTGNVSLTATGGNGGSSLLGTGGAGGSASASITRTNATGGSGLLSVVAQGGWGGGSAGGTNGAGGSATATVNAMVVGNTDLRATAFGGMGGSNGVGANGNATAKVVGTATPAGLPSVGITGLAIADSFAGSQPGSGGIALATSDVSLVASPIGPSIGTNGAGASTSALLSGGLVLSLGGWTGSATNDSGSGSFVGHSVMEARTAIGEPEPNFIRGDQGVAVLTGMAGASITTADAAVSAVLASNPLIAGAFGATPEFWAVGELGANATGVGGGGDSSVHSSVDVRVDLSHSQRHDLLVSFYHPMLGRRIHQRHDAEHLGQW